MTDLQKTRLKIVGAPLVVIFAIFIIWTIAGKSPEPAAPGTTPGTITPPATESQSWWESIGSIFKSPSEQPKAPAKNEGRAELVIPRAFQDFAGNVKIATEAVNQRALSKQVASSTPPPAGKYTVTQKEIVLNITNEEFHSLYPQKYLDSYVKDAQAFIKQNDPGYKPFATLEKDADVRLVQEKLVTILTAKNLMKAADRDQFLHNMRFVLPELQLANLEFRKNARDENNLPLVERWLRKGTRVATNAADFFVTLAAGNGGYDTPIAATEGFFAKDSISVLQKVKESLVPEALAQEDFSLGGGDSDAGVGAGQNNQAIEAFCDEDGQCCYYGAPECWKDGEAADGKPGAVTITPFCYCDSYYYYLGCVTFCENTYNAASIWDGPIGSVGGAATDICGCGLGGGGGGDAGGAGGAM